MADRLAAAGYVVLVPNVFYRHGRAPVVELPEFINPAARPEIIQSIGTAARTSRPGSPATAWAPASPCAPRAPTPTGSRGKGGASPRRLHEGECLVTSAKRVDIA
jgi:hypothetical protein